MTEPSRTLERELAAMRPRRPSIELIARIESGIAAGESQPQRDRLLMFSMSLGVLAASVIAFMWLMEPRTAVPMALPANMAASLSTPGDVPQAFAWADRRLQLDNPLENP